MCFATARSHRPWFGFTRSARSVPRIRSGPLPLAALAIVLMVLLLGIVPAYAGPAPIVGGTIARSSDWPDVVAVLGITGTCTGTLVAPDVVLTAGHCIEIEPIVVVTHADSLEPGAPGDHIDVKWSRAYPQWQDRFDVGVVVLQRIARTEPRAIATACLANQRLAAGAGVTIVGYGLTAPDASDDNTRLHAARIPVTDPFCEHAPGCMRTAGPNGEFAAGGRGTDSCYGDSGGPAYLETPSGFALAGVTSRALAIDGLPCGNGGIYARADKVVAWIQSVTDRRLERVECAGPGDDPDVLDVELDAPEGCSTQRHGGLATSFGMVLAVVLAVVLAPGRGSRRRRK